MNRTRGFEEVIETMKKTDDKVTLPTRVTSKSACYDLYANADYKVEPNEVAKIWTDVKAYMMNDEVLLLQIRSSMGGKFVLNNIQGIIDSDYYSNENNDGNIGIFLKNVSNEIQYIKRGDRIGQVMFMKYLTTDNDDATGKRTGGFGSTGTN